MNKKNVYKASDRMNEKHGKNIDARATTSHNRILKDIITG